MSSIIAFGGRLLRLHALEYVETRHEGCYLPRVFESQFLRTQLRLSAASGYENQFSPPNKQSYFSTHLVDRIAMHNIVNVEHSLIGACYQSEIAFLVLDIHTISVKIPE